LNSIQVVHVVDSFSRLMMGEILPGKVRGSAASVATAFNWACTFIVTKTFADIIGEFERKFKEVSKIFWEILQNSSTHLFFLQQPRSETTAPSGSSDQSV
jgi:hypothetical protein